MARGEDLEVCMKCGWYAHGPYRAPEACRPDLGAAADAFASQIDAPSTKLGYGDERLTFNLHENLSITLDVDTDGFWFERIFLLGCYTPEDVKELIDAIRATKIGQAIAKDQAP